MVTLTFHVHPGPVKGLVHNQARMGAERGRMVWSDYKVWDLSPILEVYDSNVGFINKALCSPTQMASFCGMVLVRFLT